MDWITGRKIVWFFVGAVQLMFTQQASALEQPRYEVVERFKTVEIRKYQSHLVARTLVSGAFDKAGNRGFKVLAGYIFGGNHGDKNIAMTAPVGLRPSAVNHRDSEGRSFWITFSMPSEYSIASLPQPNSEAVELSVVPEQYLAVLAYKGSWSEKRYLSFVDSLKQTLAQQKTWESQGDTSLLRYDPPFVPRFLRDNEVSVEVVQSAKRVEGATQ